jgi:PAS domain S-box-containing protein
MGQISPPASAGGPRPEALVAQREEIERALDGTGVGLWEWDLVTGRSTHSRLNNQMLGYEDDEELGGTFAELARKIHPEDATAMQARVEEHLRNETPFYRSEFRVLRKDGTYAWFESRGIVVERGPNGEPLRMVGTHLDISDRKANEQLRQELEKALRRNQDELEALVRLQSRKLIETADAAEQGNRAKNVFLANMSHELRGPLSVVVDESQRLLEGAAGEIPQEIREPLAQIQQAGRQLSNTVKRLLDVSSIETDTLEVCATQVNLRRVLEEQCEDVQALALERGLDLRVVVCDETLVVFADRARLAQVIRELLTNAIKFTDRGHIQVRAKAFEGTVLVEVQDTGAGIPPERQPTLFHAFEPIADRPRSLRQGLGLGLSISRAIVDAMGGSMGVTSKVGRGSRFWLTVPLAASAQKASSTRH